MPEDHPEAPLGLEIRIGPAQPADAGAIAAVHVRSWRDTYPGMLDGAVLVDLRRDRMSRHYAWRIGAGGVQVARAMGVGVIGFVGTAPARSRFGDGEIETLYVLGDWHGQGIGRALLRAGGAALAARSCTKPFVWVLEANPTRHFYAHMGGRLVGRGTTTVGGRSVPQLAYGWPSTAALRGSEAR